MTIKNYIYKVVAVNKLTSKIIEVILEPIKEKMSFTAGQFVSVSFKQDGLPKEFHPFSIASSPREGKIRLAIKALGDYTSQLIKELKVGAQAELNGPQGEFIYSLAKYKRQIWIAGGIGITPFISMAEDLVRQRGDYQIDLYYCTRNKAEAVYLNLLLKIEKQLQGKFKVVAFYSEEKGHIDVDYIRQNSGELKQRDIFICSPPRMTEELTNEFLVNGVKEKNIHWEKF